MPAEGTVYRFTSSSETAGSAEAFFRAMDELTLYPNPANGQVTLNPHITTGEQANVQLLDMSGRLVKQVYSGTLASPTIGFTVNDVKPGVYLVRVQSKAGVQTKKLSVK
jgi:hypothetical protein